MASDIFRLLMSLGYKRKLIIQKHSRNPELLKNKTSESKQVVDYKDWQIALSRRCCVMKLWISPSALATMANESNNKELNRLKKAVTESLNATA
ncbi:tyrosine/DOPA decarboxylase 2-like protein [Tanacetum coccineum]|uniref:Tyrosine/DOPA decarboxylase 2-like protein n=1 Tax=Tanacetum coccineum TaxID=301880 RepID=A0ABQ5HGY2_9ASTR